MAMVTRGRGEVTNQLKEKELILSPERVKVRAEPRLRASEKKKAAVVYYLSRNGHLEHPHFMEVTLSSSRGNLYLKDVINRLNSLRGQGLAALYSWSAKRSYKNGYVWHDLTRDDFIHPVHGNEYVLKGTELLIHNSGSSCTESSVAATSSTTSSGTDKLLEEIPKLISNKKNSNWGSLDLNEYYAFKSELLSYENNVCNVSNNVNIDASTQTDERREIILREVDNSNLSLNLNPTVDVVSSELSRDEISPPPSSSSPDQVVETMIKLRGLNLEEEDRNAGNLRGKASGVLMQLISCGISVKEQSGIGSGRRLIGGSNRFGGDKVEKKIDAFQRCSSYNYERNRGVKLEIQKEMNGVHSRCMPRNSKMKKEGVNSYLPPIISRSSNGSKRFNC